MLAAAPSDGWEVYREVHRLRVQVRDYIRARTLAEQFLAQYPTPDLLRQAVEFEHAATYYDQREWATAVSALQGVISRYFSAGFDPAGEFFLLDDGQFMVGSAHLRQAAFAQAAAAFQVVATWWPDCPTAPNAVRSANHALVRADRAAWAANRQPPYGTQNAGAIEQNLSALLANWFASGSVSPALVEAIRYFAQPGWWVAGTGATARARLIAWAERLLTVYPATNEAIIGRCELGEAICVSDPVRARLLIDTALAEALQRNLSAAIERALVAKGSLLLARGEPQGARAAFEQLLSRQPGSPVEAQARLGIACAFEREGETQSALSSYELVLSGVRFPDDVRAIAGLSRAQLLWATGDEGAARDLLEDTLARFPGMSSRPAALRLRQLWQQGRVTIIPRS